MNEDQIIDAAEREMDLYRDEIARITAQRDELGAELAVAQSEREDYAARLKATDESWAKVAAERDEAREQLAATKLVLQETSRESSQRGAELGAVRATLTQVLSWFGDNTSGRYARVSGTVLARAYRDGGLTVPEELRRYL